jgi:hypothetical protein
MLNVIMLSVCMPYHSDTQCHYAVSIIMLNEIILRVLTLCHSNTQCHCVVSFNLVSLC